MNPRRCPTLRNGYPTAFPPVDETLAIETDGTHEPERDDAQPVRAVGRVLGQAEELERGQCDGRTVARQGTDKAA